MWKIFVDSRVGFVFLFVWLYHNWNGEGLAVNEKEMERLIRKTQKNARQIHQKKDPTKYDDTLPERDYLDSETKQIFNEMKNKRKGASGPSGHDD